MYSTEVLLQKIEALIKQKQLPVLERDLLLQHIRQLYENALSIAVSNHIEQVAHLEETVTNIEIKSYANQDDEQQKSDAKEEINETEFETLLDHQTQTIDSSLENLSVEENTDIIIIHQEQKITEELYDDIIGEEDNYNDVDLVDLIVSEGGETKLKNEQPNVSAFNETNTFIIEEQKPNEIKSELVLEGNKENPTLGFKLWQKDIRTYIGINDKYNFISELFGNNSEAYEEILNEINNSENKTEAKLFLENSGVTTLYQWKEDGFSEQIFYNVLSQFFSSK